MRAIVIKEGGGPEVLQLDEVPDPEPGEGQVLVRVEAAAVNHFDVTQRRDPAAVGTSPPSVTSEQFDHLIELAGKGELSPVIHAELPLAEAAEAHRLIEAREVFGKVVLRPSQ